MARIRTVKPEYWQDEKLAPLPALYRLVFLGLVSQADDSGRLIDSVKLIDGLLFPYTDDTCADALDALAEIGVIERGVTESGQAVIQVAGFAKHQKIDRPNLRGALPPIVKPHTPQRFVEPSSNLRRSSDEDAPNHTLDQLPATSDQRPTTSADAPIVETPALRKSGRSAAGAAHTQAEQFERFWKAYPRRAGGNPKRRALKAWQARMRDHVDPDDVLAGLRRYVAFLDATGKVGTEFVMQAATFLGPDERWSEPWSLDRAKAPKPPPGSEAAAGHEEVPGRNGASRNGGFHHVSGAKVEDQEEQRDRLVQQWSAENPADAKAIADEVRDHMAADTKLHGTPAGIVERMARSLYRNRVLERLDTAGVS